MSARVRQTAKLKDLADMSSRLAGSWEGALVLLKEGRPFAPEVLEEGALFLKQYRALLGDMDWRSGCEDGDEAPPITVLLALAVRMEEEQTRLCREVQEVLEAASQVRHRHKGRDFPGLDAVARKADELSHLLEAPVAKPSEEVSDLMAGTHPINHLLRLAQQADELDEADCQESQTIVSESFHPLLAVAGVSGRLVVEPALDIPPLGETEQAGRVDPLSPEGVSDPQGSLAGPSPPLPGVNQDPQEADRQDPPLTSCEGTPEQRLSEDAPADVREGLPATLLPEMATDSERKSEEGVIAPARVVPHTPQTPPLPEGEEKGSVATPEAPPEFDEMAREVNRAVWSLISQRRFGLAAMITSLADESAMTEGLPAPQLLEALALSEHVVEPEGALAQALKEAFDHFVEIPTTSWAQLLFWSAALRPSLVSPSTGASGILQQIKLKNGFGALFQLTQAVLNASDSIRGITPLQLRTGKGEVAWQDNWDGLMRAIETWEEQAPTRTTKFQAASRVWQIWVRAEGLLGGLVSALKVPDESRLASIQKTIKDLENPAAFRQKVNAEDRKRRRVGTEIHASALSQLRDLTDGVLDLGRKWCELMQAKPDRSDFIHGQLNALREAYLDLAPKVEQEIQALRTGSDYRERATAACALTAFAAVRQLLAASPVHETDLRRATLLLRGELLAVPTLELADGLQPMGAERGELLHLLLPLHDAPVDWAVAFAGRCTTGDVQSARILLDEFITEGEARSHLQDQLDRVRQERTAVLSAAIARTRERVEEALAFGLLSEEERGPLDDELVSLQQRIESGLLPHYGVAARRLEAIEGHLGKRREDEQARALQRLAAISLPEGSLDGLRTRQLVEKGDLLTANEYIGRLEAGQPTDEVVGGDRAPFLEFFPEGSHNLDQALSNLSARQVVKKIGDRGEIGGLKFGSVPKAQVNEAVDMMTAWYEIKDKTIADVQRLGRVLKGLGFNVRALRGETAGKVAKFEMEADVVSDRAVCPVPSYGSEACGRYRILCIWGRPSEEEILSLAGDTADPRQRATFVLYFGRLSEMRRRNLGRLCKERRKTLLVIDESLMVFLCAERGLRLSVMFSCTLPFAHLEPYVTSSNIVPPEMFYGRRAELDALVNPNRGECLIYGGRQLGKSALLREAQRIFHDGKNHVAVWIDLSADSIGKGRPPEDLWVVLFRELQRGGVIEKKAKEPNPKVRDTVERFKALIEGWVNADASRRMLLLLDEADKFFDQDSRNDFRVTEQLKGLMLKTNRRVKVAFAGLHNVRRTVALSNQPLVQLGEPIKVGPLFGREARELVEVPLGALGYRFSSPELVTRILAQTNYFPSLLQLYCAQLLRRLSDTRSPLMDYRSGPPYLIGDKHLDEVSQSKDLREDIRQRFLWTIQLDRRYKVIAYTIALAMVGDEIPAEGIPKADIMREARSWWPEGFEKTNDRQFESLLDEMVDLGVLRSAADGRGYLLRNRNILNLLGRKDEIERVLIEDREPEVEFSARVFHAGTCGGAQPEERCPLTYEQESYLQEKGRYGISVIAGCEAAGLKRLPYHLQARLGSEYLQVWRDHATPVDFRQGLDDFQERGREGTTLLMVPEDVPWSLAWLDLAHGRLQRFRSRDRIVRLVFLADTMRVWTEVTQEAGRLDALEVDLMSLGPWDEQFLRQWLEDVNLPTSAKDRDLLTAVTGNWYQLILDFYREGQQAKNWLPFLERKEAELGKSSAAAKGLLEAFGPWPPTALAALTQVADMDRDEGVIAADELPLLAEMTEIPEEDYRRVIRWAEVTRLVSARGSETWKLDPLVKRLLLAADPDGR